MMTSRVEYLDGLRTKCTHVKSGTEIYTDAPVDNNGKGESFSPTDLVATAYGSCMLTIVGIYCEKNDIELKGATAGIVKVMGAGPRRISALTVEVDFSMNNWSSETKEKIQQVAEACPVAQSVHDDMEITFKYTF